MNRSLEINELAAALAKAQGKIAGAVRDSQNPFFNSTYADLASVWEVCRGPLSENGLAVVQLPSKTNDIVSVENLLMHTSGQFISEILSARLMRQKRINKDGEKITIFEPTEDPQVLGSLISYLRRYGLAALVGIYQVDDDAEGAMARPPVCTPKLAQHDHPKPAPAPAKPENLQQKADADARPAGIAEIYASAKGRGIPDEEWRAKLAAVGVTKDKRSQSKERLIAIGQWVIDWIPTTTIASNSAEHDPVAWLREVARAAHLLDDVAILDFAVKHIGISSDIPDLVLLTAAELTAIAEAIDKVAGDVK